MIMGVPSINFRITLLVLTLLIIFLSQNRTEGVPTFLSYACPNISTFNVNPPNSTYQSNRNNLLLYLSSNATGNTEYYNATASTVSSVEHTVYGLFVCRGDMSTDDCRDCVADATKEIVNLCPVQKAAIAWYEQCMIRYSNRYIFSSIIGLLCVQDNPIDRPTMASIVLILNSYSMTLSSPKQPAYFLRSRIEEIMPLKESELSDKSTSKSMPGSVNEASITEVYPR